MAGGVIFTDCNISVHRGWVGRLWVGEGGLVGIFPAGKVAVVPLLRGGVVNRTYGTHRNLYFTYFYPQ